VISRTKQALEAEFASRMAEKEEQLKRCSEQLLSEHERGFRAGELSMMTAREVTVAKMHTPYGERFIQAYLDRVGRSATQIHIG
jgi:hypothetical protein